MNDEQLQALKDFVKSDYAEAKADWIKAQDEGKAIAMTAYDLQMITLKKVALYISLKFYDELTNH